MPVRIRQHHGDGADGLGLGKQRGERRPAFQGVGVEQVEQAGRVVAEAVRLQPDA